MKKSKKGEEERNLFSRLLLSWYCAERRILPWREDPTPYHVWLSEIMLQQTRVEAVKEYYRRFLEVLPDVRSLAEAEEPVYLKLWEGLGYYSRVRNMHRAAVIVMEQYGGRIPGTCSELEKLPGIGRYTAAAIASIAFGEAVPSVDGNLLRVHARMTCSEENILLGSAKKKAEEWYRSIIPFDAPGDFNQAVMDLGAAVCLPNTEPKCGICPWADFCQSRAAGTEQLYPVRIKKTKRKTEEWTVFLIEDGEKVLLRKRPDTGLLAGLYEFPSEPGSLEEEEAGKRLAAYGIRIESLQRLPEAKHVFSHVTWRMKGYRVKTGSLSDLKKAGEMTEAEGAVSDGSHPAEETAGTILTAAAPEELETRYAIPAAFETYRKLLQKK